MRKPCTSALAAATTVAVAAALVALPGRACAAGADGPVTVLLTVFNRSAPFGGELSLRVAADPTVSLAQDPGRQGTDANGHRFSVLTGILQGIAVLDSRPDQPGWTLTGEAIDIVGPTKVAASNFGWVPTLVAGSDAEGSPKAGPAVGPAPQKGSGGGLGAPVGNLAFAPFGSGLGTERVSAVITLQVPATELIGTYSGTLTLTLTSS